MKYLTLIALVLALQGCNNAMQPRYYNKAEELCTKYNEKVLKASEDPLATDSSVFKLTIWCTNNLKIHSDIK